MSTQIKDKKDENYTVNLPFFGIGRLIPYLRPYMGKLIVMILMGIVGSCVDIVLPLFQKYAIDTFIARSVLDGLWGFIIFYVLTLIVQVISNSISTYNSTYIEMHVGRDLKCASFNHLQTLSFSYFNQNSVGYIHARVMSDTSRIGELVSWGIMDGVWHISYIIGAAFVMFSINTSLALLVCSVIPFTAVMTALLEGKLVKINRQIREINSRITGKWNEGITGAKTVKTLTVEDKMAKDFYSVTGEMKKKSVAQARYSALFRSVTSFASMLALALVLWKGGILTSQQLIDVGTLSVFMSYALGMMNPTRWIVECISILISTQVNIERLTDLIETKSDVSDDPEVTEKYGDAFSPKKENWEKLCGDIEFRDVSFMYPDGDEYVLEHFDLSVPKGTTVAIVGETGAGKSTLVNLVCRFFEPTSGELLIDGRNAKERSQLWLHSNIGYVLQTPHLFSGTVRENLIYGKPDATDEEIMSALRTVSAESVIEKLDGGLDGEVGEGGDLLSTGEKQLLSFARAILADPAILVLDEATSSIDTVTEALIQDAIGKVTNGRTSFIIAHRLSTIRNADVILVVRDGKIIERGRHRELMKQKGYYYSLFTRQYEQDAVDSVI